MPPAPAEGGWGFTWYGSGATAPSGSHLPRERHPWKRVPVVELHCGPSNAGHLRGSGLGRGVPLWALVLWSPSSALVKKCLPLFVGPLLVGMATIQCQG